MGSSCVYHLFNSMSREIYLKLLKVDLIGISFMIFGLAISLIYTGFHNYPRYGSSLTALMLLLMTANSLL